MLDVLLPASRLQPDAPMPPGSGKRRVEVLRSITCLR